MDNDSVADAGSMQKKNLVEFVHFKMFKLNVKRICTNDIWLQGRGKTHK